MDLVVFALECLAYQYYPMIALETKCTSSVELDMIVIESDDDSVETSE